MSRYFSWLFVVVPLAVVSCTDTDLDFAPDGGTDAVALPDGLEVCDDPSGDYDQDGISNGDEGCAVARDNDSDGTADWQDQDADQDGIPDSIEKGEKNAEGRCATTQAPANAWPCDTDGDGYPDYLDVDSDGDNIDDGSEDVNGDGLIGCCLTQCGVTGGNQATDCILTRVGDIVGGEALIAGQEGCGPGQRCENGACTPPVGFSCSNGETSPVMVDTFGDGKLDSERGTFICRDASEDKPEGRKAIKTANSEPGDWHVALETTAEYGELKIKGAGPKDVAGVVDVKDPATEVAGFVISRETDQQNIQDELSAILAALQSRIPGGSGTITVRASGTQGKSHDRYDTIKGTILDLQLSSTSNVSTVRNELVGAVLNRPMAELADLPGPFGSSHTDFIVRFVSVRRFAFKRKADDKLELDEAGNPIDDGDQTKWRLVVMGAIAGRDNFQDATRPTGFVVDDMSNGTTLATASDQVDDECDVGTITKLPVADVVWVIDESGSMTDNRDDIVNNANNFFSRALASGLDFRMGVTNVISPGGTHAAHIGKFCSKISADAQDDGGVDRFLQATEQAIFSSCIKNPPGDEGYAEHGLLNAQEAMKRHLPRTPGDASRFRPGASIAFIVATDEADHELKEGDKKVISSSKVCQLPGAEQAEVNARVKPLIDLFSGAVDAEAAASFHVIGGVCNNSCNADVAHGYKEVAQALSGQIGDVCQKDLGNTLQVMIDSIVGAASPVVLERVPITTSLAVALDGLQLQRSRNNGFDYRAGNNSIALINVQFEKGSELISSYKRWRKQTAIE